MANEPLKPPAGGKPLGAPKLIPAHQPATGDAIPLAAGPAANPTLNMGARKPGAVPLRPLGAGNAAGLPAGLKEPRLVSLDAFRGFVMLMMASSGFALAQVANRLRAAGTSEDSTEFKIVRTLADQFSHAVWQGGVFWDLIQPAFMFMVGVALPYSYGKRLARGDSYISRLLHTLARCVLLVAIGVFLANPTGSKEQPYTVFTFANVLCQIGLGYFFVFLFVNRGLWLEVAAIAAVLGGTWYAFFQHPLPPEDFDYASVGVPRTVKVKENGVEKEVPNPEFEQVILPGLKGHWSKNVNFASDVDRDLLNRFPRTQAPPRRDGETDDAYASRVEENRKQYEFQFNSGGYATLNFVPSIATMLLGLIIGELLRRLDKSSGDKLIAMLLGGAVCLAVGVALHFTVCPIVKRIWTPSWALASGGLVIWMLALFYLVIDHFGWRRIAWPLAVVGMNSLLVYLMAQLLKGWTLKAIYTHLTIPYAKLAGWLAEATGKPISRELLGGASNPYQPLYETLAVLFVFWLVCVWLYRQRLFVRL